MCLHPQQAGFVLLQTCCIWCRPYSKISFASQIMSQYFILWVQFNHKFSYEIARDWKWSPHLIKWPAQDRLLAQAGELQQEKMFGYGCTPGCGKLESSFKASGGSGRANYGNSENKMECLIFGHSSVHTRDTLFVSLWSSRLSSGQNTVSVALFWYSESQGGVCPLWLFPCFLSLAQLNWFNFFFSEEGTACGWPLSNSLLN